MSRRRIHLALAILTAAAIPFPARPARADEQIVYRFDPSSITRDDRLGWTSLPTTVTPQNDVRLLGPYYEDRGTLLKLSSLPKHRLAVVRFELVNIFSPDGSSETAGPDIWRLSADGNEIFATTFHFNPNGIADRAQAYPDFYPEGWHPSVTGADMVGEFGYVTPIVDPPDCFRNDSLYRIELVFPHSSDSLQLHFASTYRSESWREEQWALREVQVAVMAEPEDLWTRDIEEIWKQFQSPDPVAANEARWRLIRCGEHAARFIAGRLADTNAVARLKAIVMALNRDDVAAKARAALAALSEEELLLLRGFWDSGDLPPGIQGALRSRIIENELAGSLFVLRLRQVLNMIEGDKADEALARVTAWDDPVRAALIVEAVTLIDSGSENAIERARRLLLINGRGRIPVMREAALILSDPAASKKLDEMILLVQARFGAS